MPLPDADLIQGFTAGSEASLKQVDVWIAEVLRHPGLRLENEFEDVAQQVRSKLLISLRAGRFQGASSLRTYVWRIAKHAAIDHLRKRRSSRPALSIDDVAEPTEPSPSPEAALLHQERREVFALVLSRLGEGCQKLFHLIVFDELSYQEIARRLQTSEGAIKVRALRCREQAALQYKSVTSNPGARPLQTRDIETE
jgi:RNA polymerase sigma-70 factor (ECF subfamily)